MVNESAGSKGGVSGGSSDWGLAKTTAVPLLAASAQGLHWGEDRHLARRDHGGEQGSDARDFLATATRREKSTAKPLSRSHVTSYHAAAVASCDSFLLSWS
jgi:hypothetical protein